MIKKTSRLISFLYATLKKIYMRLKEKEKTYKNRN